MKFVDDDDDDDDNESVISLMNLVIDYPACQGIKAINCHKNTFIVCW